MSTSASNIQKNISYICLKYRNNFKKNKDMGITIYESGEVKTATFGQTEASTFKIVYADGVIDASETANVVFANDKVGVNVPIIALLNGNARLKEITNATIAQDLIWIGLQ
jgi:hypothetical protein